MGKISDAVRNPNFWLKVAELVTAVVALFFWDYLQIGEKTTDVTAIGVITASKGTCIAVGLEGYQLITFVYVIMYLFSETNPVLEIYLTFLGAVHTLVAAIFLFMWHSDAFKCLFKETKCAKTFFLIIGILSAVCCALCIADMIIKIIKKD